MSKPKIGVYDIETFPMQVYTWSLYKPIIGINQIISPGRVAGVGWQWHGSSKVEWLSEFDLGHEEMIRQVHQRIDEADAVGTWNGNSFDTPHMRSEFIELGLPPTSPTKQIDLMRIARQQFRLPSYKLDYVAQYLGLGAKLSTGGFELWRDCMDGDPKAWARMGRYCKQDVRLTDAILDRFIPYLPPSFNYGLYVNEDVCPRCGSDDLERRGYAYTGLGKFQRYQCQGCGGWTRSGTAVSRVDLRGVA